ncbi:MAG: FAD-dependent monooxygenase, partial [Betaproteobacteria bacterium]
MQFYLDGYQPGDPDILAAAPGAENRSAKLPEAVDVLIIGSGPSGSLLAAQLSAFPDISTRLIERRDGPLQLGQADGVACRTVEMFEAFGLSEKLVREANWVTETVFWRPSPEDRAKIVRTGRIDDTEKGLSEFPHVIVNQARMQQYLLDFMRRSPSRLEADYGMEFVTLKVESAGEYPVVVTLRHVADDSQTTIRARYVVGCDGARSKVREAIGAEPRGDFANHAWGVVDMLAVTDFPDIRLK